jgi:hypothetical protein
VQLISCAKVYGAYGKRKIQVGEEPERTQELSPKNPVWSLGFILRFGTPVKDLK